jgi:putative FmdB family regulatory protein
MPFYEYQCAACKFYLEVLQKISDAPLKKCPSCGKSKLQKLISAPVFRLKGAGWYETDFKSDKENKRNLAGDGNDGADAKAAAPAADAKPAESKADPKPAEKAAAGEAKSISAVSSGRSGSKAAASKPVKPAAKVPARKGAAKPKPKPKPKAAKRRG